MPPRNHPPEPYRKGLLILMLGVAGMMSALVVAAQEPYLDRFRLLTIDDGLPSNTVYSICQDKEGFIWLGTGDGLCRFDGYRISVFRDLSAEKNSSRRNYMRHVFMDRDGDVWIGMEHGLCRFDHITGRFENRFSADTELKENNLLVSTQVPYAQLGTGRVLIYAFALGNVLLDKTSGNFTPFTGGGLEKIRYALPLAADSVQVIYATDSTIFRLNLQTGRVQQLVTLPFQPRLPPLAGYVGAGECCFLQPEGIVRIQLVSDRFTVYPMTPYLTLGDTIWKDFHMTRGKGGLYFVGAKSYGLLVFSHDFRLLRQYRQDKKTSLALQSDLVETIYSDRNGHIWVGTDLGGVACLSSGNRFSASLYDHLPEKFISCFYRKDSLIYAGVLHEGLACLDLRSRRTTLLPLKHQPKSIRCIREVNGELWLGSELGIIMLDRSGGVQQLLPTDMTELELIKDIYPAADGSVWVATNRKLLRLHRQDGEWTVNRVSAVPTSDIVEELNGRLLVCSRNCLEPGGLHLTPAWRVEKDGVVYLERTTAALRDERGEVWAATADGLVHFDENFHPLDTFGPENSPMHTQVLSLEKYKNQLWISCNNYLFCMDAATQEFFTFDVQDGLTSAEFVSNASYRDSENYLYFGSISGFARFHPDSFTLYRQPLRPYITGIRVFNDTYTDTLSRFIRKITLPHHRNSLFIEFSAPEPLYQYRIRYAYRLGQQGDWMDLETANAFWLTHLPPGRYELYIRCTTADGIWCEPVKVLTLRIRPPFWLTWWCITGEALLGLLLLYLLIRYISVRKYRRRIDELRKQEEIDNERLRISRDMHDELGSGLSRIKFLSDMLAEGHADETQRKTMLRSIADTSGNIVENMRELIWVMNTERTLLAALAARIREYAVDYLEDFPLELSVHFPADVPERPISREAYRNLFMLVKESLQNIVKHAGASQVALQLTLTDMLMLVITDNGCGFNPETARGNGLRNMRTRATSLGGELLIHSAASGTRVEIRVPLEKIYIG